MATSNEVVQIAEDSNTTITNNHGAQNGPDAPPYNDPKHADIMLTALEGIWKDKTFCDVIIKVKDQEFPTHRNVLASFSLFFKALLTNGMAESNQKVITLESVEPDIFQLLMEFCYTGKVKITQDNLFNLLAAANFFDIQSVRDACCQYLSNRKMDTSFCLDMLQLPEQHITHALKKKAIDFALTNFENVSLNPGFAALDVDIILEIILNDELIVTNETLVMAAVAEWYSLLSTRKAGFEKLIEAVRFPLMSSGALCKTMETMMKRLTFDSPRLKELVEEAKTCQLCPEVYRQLQETSTNARYKKRSYTGDICIVGCVFEFHLSHVRGLGDRAVSCPMVNISNASWEMFVRKVNRPSVYADDGDIYMIDLGFCYILDSDSDVEKSTEKTCSISIRLKRQPQTARGQIFEMSRTYSVNIKSGQNIALKDFCRYRQLVSSQYHAYNRTRDDVTFIVQINM